MTCSYAKFYSPAKFTNKLKTLPAAASIKLMKTAVKLYVLLQEPMVPALTKVVIVGALGYFICPIDIVPDFIPIAGFGDDLTVLTAVLYKVDAFDDPYIDERVDEIMADWIL